MSTFPMAAIPLGPERFLSEMMDQVIREEDLDEERKWALIMAGFNLAGLHCETADKTSEAIAYFGWMLEHTGSVPATARVPAQLMALAGLGRAYHSRGDLVTADAAFRQLDRLPVDATWPVERSLELLVSRQAHLRVLADLKHHDAIEEMVDRVTGRFAASPEPKIARAILGLRLMSARLLALGGAAAAAIRCWRELLDAPETPGQNIHQAVGGAVLDVGLELTCSQRYHDAMAHLKLYLETFGLEPAHPRYQEVGYALERIADRLWSNDIGATQIDAYKAHYHYFHDAPDPKVRGRALGSKLALADSLEAQGRIGEAIACLEELRQRPVGDVPPEAVAHVAGAWFKLAELLNNVGQYALELDVLREAERHWGHLADPDVKRQTVRGLLRQAAYQGWAGHWADMGDVATAAIRRGLELSEAPGRHTSPLLRGLLGGGPPLEPPRQRLLIALTEAIMRFAPSADPYEELKDAIRPLRDDPRERAAAQRRLEKDIRIERELEAAGSASLQYFTAWCRWRVGVQRYQLQRYGEAAATFLQVLDRHGSSRDPIVSTAVALAAFCYWHTQIAAAKRLWSTEGKAAGQAALARVRDQLAGADITTPPCRLLTAYVHALLEDLPRATGVLQDAVAAGGLELCTLGAALEKVHPLPEDHRWLALLSAMAPTPKTSA